jgi:hypothetical protein
MNNSKELVFKFEKLGIRKISNGAILIGKAPHIAPEAWLNELYPTLNEVDIAELESELNKKIPIVYKNFLIEFSNGLSILNATFSLDGLRGNYDRTTDGSRQPFSLITPNIYERPKNAKSNFFFIGGYNWDGSHLYIDTETNFVHYCKRWDATSLYQWSSFDEMLYSEIERIYKLFDEEGKEINEDVTTTPI